MDHFTIRLPSSLCTVPIRRLRLSDWSDWCRYRLRSLLRVIFHFIKNFKQLTKLLMVCVFSFKLFMNREKSLFVQKSASPWNACRLCHYAFPCFSFCRLELIKSLKCWVVFCCWTRFKWTYFAEIVAYSLPIQIVSNFERIEET